MRLLYSKGRLQRRLTTTALGKSAATPAQQKGRPEAAAAGKDYEWPAILDQAEQPAFVHDAGLRILRCNQAYATEAGLAMEEIVGKPYWQVFPMLATGPPAPCPLGGAPEEPAPIVTSDTGRIFAVQRIATHCTAGRFWYCGHLFQDITEQKRLENDLAREKMISDAIIECAPSAFFLLDRDARLVRWNSNVRERSGLSDDELRDCSALSLVHGSERAVAEAKLLTAFATGYARVELRAGCGRDASYLLATGRRLMLDGVPYVAGFCTDITDRRRIERQLEDQKAFADALIENIPGVFCVLDTEGNYVRWNSNLNRLTGLGDAELYGRSSLLTIVEDDRPQAADRLRDTFEQGYVRTVLRVDTHDRGPRAFLMTGRRFEVDGVPYVVGVGIDTTDQLAMIRALEHETRTDGLTNLANRSHFLDRASYELARCRRYGHAFSIWMLDLDCFKSINDTHGHQAGDAVLRAVVATSRRMLRDWDIMGRMGGEEFGVVLPETDATQSLLIAERLRQAVAAAVIRVGDGSPVSVTVSIGIAIMGEDDGDVHAMLGRADRALYHAKETGRNKVCVA